MSCPFLLAGALFRGGIANSAAGYYYRRENDKALFRRRRINRQLKPLSFLDDILAGNRRRLRGFHDSGSESHFTWGEILAYKSAASTYRETRVTTAGQGQLIIMLYNEAVKYLDEALQTLETDESGKMDPRNIERFGRNVVKAQEIITELMVSLDLEQGGDIAKNLFSVYTWFNHELLEANISRDYTRIAKVRDFVEDLRGAWHEVISTGATEAQGRASGISIAG